MKLLSVVSEIFPIIKTGGLADVAGALPGALAAHGVETVTLLPGYPAVAAAARDGRVALRMDDLFGGAATLLRAQASGLDLLVLDAPHLYARSGGIYGWGDDAVRFAALSRVAAEVGLGGVPEFRPDVVHTHDWQTGLVAAYLHYDGRPRPGTVATIHNLAFQGDFPASLFPRLGLPARAYAVDGVEYYGGVGYLKAALYCSDRITTVSPSYANEILTPDFGMGMDGLLRGRAGDLFGILNGIDTAVWDPSADPLIPARYAADSIEARAANKAALQARTGLAADPDAPLFGAVTRFSWQKGVDLLLGLIPLLRQLGAQLVLLGAGDDGYERDARAAGAAAPGQIATYVGYDEGLAHLVQAGADALLVPSRFEPCGLTQLCALRYGAVPVVARTGGLADTVIDASPMGLAAGAATGIQFAPTTPEMLAAAVRRTVSLYADRPTWRRLQRNGMATDVSWRDPARRYAEIFRAIAPAA